MSTNKTNTNHTARRLRRATALLLTAGTLTAGMIATPAWAPTGSGCGGASCGIAPPAATK